MLGLVESGLVWFGLADHDLVFGLSTDNQNFIYEFVLGMYIVQTHTHTPVYRYRVAHIKK